MRFSTRAFLWYFPAFAALLAGSFWAVRTSAIAAVRDGLRVRVRDHQTAMARERAQARQRNIKVLGGVAENPALKAGLELVATEHSAKPEARRTLEDQLSEMGDLLGFDLLALSDSSGELVAGVLRGGRGFAPLRAGISRPPLEGFFESDGRVYQVASVPMNRGMEFAGMLTVGEPFDAASFTSPVVLTHQGRLVATSARNLPRQEIEAAVQRCAPDRECDVRLAGQTFLSLPMEEALQDGVPPSNGYLLRSLQSVDQATAPVEAVLRRVFLASGVLSLLAALAITAFCSRSMVRPLGALVGGLRTSEETGVLVELPPDTSGTLEIRHLNEGFNRAAASIRDGRNRLLRAHVAFIEGLASALDARDPYTAGHSRRVAEYSCAIARVMNVPEHETEIVRVGALLHDVGKIGVSDTVLRKPGRLTPAEFALIQEHPVIGRRILEGLLGFEEYLPVVELHHEDWDGTGYPHRLKGEQTLLAARIVRVADAYDAMTSDRPYRRGMADEQARRILEENAGMQFDPAVVRAFASLAPRSRPESAPDQVAAGLQNLADAVGLQSQRVAAGLADGRAS